MKNDTCYISLETLTKDNMSLEHIIPNALGGRIKSNHLLNKIWNNKFGNEIENELIKQIPLPTLLEINRDRGNNPKLKAKTEDGNKYLVHNSKTGMQRPKEPSVTHLSNGEIKYNFIQGQEEGILKKLQKENPNTTTETLRQQIKWSTPNPTKTIFFHNGFSLISGTKAIRAVCKIATNYYVYKKNETEGVQPIVPFIKGESEGIGVLKYYYLPTEDITYGEKEISHIIHIEGNKKGNLLIAYVELFNCYNFLIVLNKNYKGENINDTYCYDLILNKIISKEISLNITKEKLSDFKFPQDINSEFEFQKRLKRVLDIKNIKFQIKATSR